MGTLLQYDLEAGERLSSLLAQLHDKLAALAQFRARQKTSLLDFTPGNWLGGARDLYDRDYAIQQQQLAFLSDRALGLKARVDQANQDYTAARRTPGRGNIR